MAEGLGTQEVILGRGLLDGHLWLSSVPLVSDEPFDVVPFKLELTVK